MLSSKKIVKLVAIFLIMLVTIASIKLLTNKYPPVEGWSKKNQPFQDHNIADISIKKSFLTDNNKSPATRYQSLFEYFALGFVKYRSQNGALVYYPGEHSSHGLRVDALEGFSRFFPLAAAYLASGNEATLELDGEKVNFIQILRQGIIAGTDPNNPEYWGDIKDQDQRIVEAADIALGLWISRNILYSNFSIEEQNQVVSWLEGVIKRKVIDNNWLLFPVVTLKSLQGLGVNNPKYNKEIQEKYQKYKRLYSGEGWFNDPPKGFDYYNAWAVHYTLFWLDQIDPQFDPDFIQSTQTEFLEFYRYLFSKNGFPMMGRSTCYRLGAPAPIIAGTLIAPDLISPGFAYRVLDLTWSFFIQHDALREGTVTQGYCGQNISVLNRYSGAGSCLWSLRSLVTAFYVDQFIPFWESSSEQLPIEVSDFSIVNKSIGWLIKGERSTQTIELHLLKEETSEIPEIKQYGIFHKLMESVFQKPFRPNNSQALYHRPIYSTASPVVKCE